MAVFKKRHLGVFVLAVVASTTTPLFATVMAQILTSLGDYYGNIAKDPPTAYVLLGGGLSKKNGVITLNDYSDKRTQTLITAWQKHPLPIVLSGVESPWLYDRLGELNKYHDKTAPFVVIADNASMNTCENARFSQKIIDYEQSLGTIGSTTHVYLVSDAYHMARARRQFAQAGLATTPIIAPLPAPLAWRRPKDNLNHARRAIYEMTALLRDVALTQTDCRDATALPIAIIKTPRREPKTFD